MKRKLLAFAALVASAAGLAACTGAYYGGDYGYRRHYYDGDGHRHDYGGGWYDRDGYYHEGDRDRGHD